MAGISPILPDAELSGFNGFRVDQVSTDQDQEAERQRQEALASDQERQQREAEAASRAMFDQAAQVEPPSVDERLAAVQSDVPIPPEQRPGQGRFSPFDDIFAAHAPPELAQNPEFMSIVATAAKAESGWDPQSAGGGLFQIHPIHGKGPEVTNDPDKSTAFMMPRFVDAYNEAKAVNPNLSGSELAALVSAQAERPAGYDDPTSKAWNNYRRAYAEVMNGSGVDTQYTPVTSADQAQGSILTHNLMRVGQITGQPMSIEDYNRQRIQRVVDSQPQIGGAGSIGGSQIGDSGDGISSDLTFDFKSKTPPPSLTAGNPQNTANPQESGPSGPTQRASDALIQNQFGDKALSQDEALAACGPAAYVAFARASGRNPTLREAVDLAKTYGWNASAGMSGPANQVKMLNDQGIPAEMGGLDPQRIDAELAAGRPVSVSTPGHYFVLTDRNDDGSYHVGASGTAYKSGGTDMTLDQMQRVGGGRANGVIYMKGQPEQPAQMAPPAPDAGSGGDTGIDAGGAGGAPEPIMDPRDARGYTGPPTQQPPQQGPQMPDIGGAIGSGLSALGQMRDQNLGTPDANGMVLDQNGSVRSPVEPIDAMFNQAQDAIHSKFNDVGQIPGVGAANEAIGNASQAAATGVLHAAETAYPGLAAGREMLGLPDQTPNIKPLDIAEQAAMLSLGNPENPANVAALTGPAARRAALEQVLPGVRELPEGVASRAEPFLSAGGGQGADDFEQSLAQLRQQAQAGDKAAADQLNEYARLRGAEERQKVLYGPEPGDVAPSPAAEPGRRLPGVTPAQAEETLGQIGTGAANAQAGEGPLTEEAQKLMPNLMKMNVSDDAKASAIRITEMNEPIMQAAQRGTVSWETTDAAARTLGITREQFLNSPVGKGWNEVELRSLIQMNTSLLDSSTKLADLVAARGGGEDAEAFREGLKALSPVERADALKQMSDMIGLQGVTRGGRSTAGRTLNIAKMETAPEAINSPQITKLQELVDTAAKGREGAVDRIRSLNGQARATFEGGTIPGQGVPSANTERLIPDLLARKPMDPDLKAALNDMRQSNNAALRDWEKRFREIADPYPLSPAEVKRTLESVDQALAESRQGTLSNTTLQQLNQRADELKAGEAEFRKAYDYASNKDLRDALADAQDEHRFWSTDWDFKMRALEAEKGKQSRAAQKLLEKMTGGKEGVTDEMLATFLKYVHDGNPIDTAKYLRGLNDPRWWGRLQSLRYNSMLSSTQTQLVQALSNGLNLGTDVANQLITSGIESAWHPNGVQAVSSAETRPMLTGMGNGAISAFKNDFLNVLKYGATPEQLGRFEVQSGFGAEHIAGGRIPSNIADRIDKAVEFPTRLMTAGDWVVRQMAYHGRLNQLAVRQAVQEGLTGAARAERAAEILTNLDQFPNIVKNAEEFGKHTVFQESRGLSNWAVNTRDLTIMPEGPGKKIGQKVTQTLFPFLRTPVNVLVQGYENSPLGFLRLFGEIPQYRAAMKEAQEASKAAEALRSGGEQPFRALSLDGRLQEGANGQALSAADQRVLDARERVLDVVGHASIGSAVAAMGGALGAMGFLTGPPPESASQRNTLPPGWQPWAVKVGDRYVALSNIGPLALPLALGAIGGNAARDGKADPILLTKIGDLVTKQSFLQSLKDYLDFATNPNQNSQAKQWERLSESFAGSYAPYGALTTELNRALGMAPRDPHGALEAIEARLPLLAGNVRPQLDVTGQPVSTQEKGLAALVAPVRITQAQDTPWLQALREKNIPLGTPPATRDGVQIPDDQYFKLRQETGQNTAERLGQAINSPIYQRAGADEQKRLLENEVGKARSDARSEADIAPSRRPDQPWKYIGITDVKREQQIDDMVSKYNAWVGAGRRGPSGLTGAQMAQAPMYEKRISPAYTRWSKANRVDAYQLNQAVGASR